MVKVNVYAFCFNEERFLPFFLRHYEQFCQRIIVFDNGSTDRSIEIVTSHPKGEVVRFDTLGRVREDTFNEIRNHAWKKDRWSVDFMVAVVDLDEFIWHPDMPGLLERAKATGTSLPRVNGYTMCHPFFPDPHDDPRPLTEIVGNGSYDACYNKRVLFDPKKIREINFSVGAHYQSPTGEVVPPNNNPPGEDGIHAPWREEDPEAPLKLLHYRNFGFDEFRERAIRFRPRSSPGSYYGKQFDLTEEDWNREWNKPESKVVRVVS